jgi:hypothetical protein
MRSFYKDRRKERVKVLAARSHLAPLAGRVGIRASARGFRARDDGGPAIAEPCMISKDPSPRPSLCKPGEGELYGSDPLDQMKA